MGNLEFRFRYCFSIPGLLKWLAIIFSGVVLGLLCWESIQENDTDGLRGPTERELHTEGELYTVIVALFTIKLQFLLLLLFFINCHNSLCSGCRCRTVATCIYLLCLCLWVAAGIVQVWMTIKLKKSWTVYDTVFLNRRAASAAFCFANVLVFMAALQQAYYMEI